MIKAFHIFSQNNKSADLVIVGDGPTKDELQKLVNDLQLSKRVYFLGRIEHQKLLRSNIYHQALAFVTASKSETQCISVLEAMNHGLPIIGVKSRALPELIKNNGLICKPDDIPALAQAFNLIVQNPKKRREFSINSLELIKKHTIEQTVKELGEVYKKLITSFAS